MADAPSPRFSGRDFLLAGVLVLAAAWLYLAGLGGHALWDPFEPVQAQITSEMLQEGSWVIPRYAGEERWAEPPLYAWLSMPGTVVWGSNELTARLPSAVLALLAIPFLFVVLRRTGMPAGGAFMGAFVLLTNPFWCFFARHAIPDTICAALLLYAIGFALLARFGGGGAATCHRLAYAFLGLATLSKGLVVPALAVLAWLIYALGSSTAREGNPRSSLQAIWRELQRMRFPSGLLVFFAITLPWYVAALAHDSERFFEYLDDFEELLPFRQAGGHDGSVATYFESLFHGGFPWLGFVPVVLVFLANETLERRQARIVPPGEEEAEAGRDATATDDRGRLGWYLVSWVLATLTLLALGAPKESHFLLPMIAPASALVAFAWVNYFGKSRFFWARGAMVVSCLTWYVATKDFEHEGNIRVLDAFHTSRTIYDPFLLDVIEYFLYAWVVLCVAASLLRGSRVVCALLCLLAFGYAAFLCHDVIPGHTPCRSVREYCTLMERFGGDRKHVVLLGNHIPSLHYYLRGTPYERIRDRDLARFDQEIREIAAEAREAGATLFVVTRYERWQAVERSVERHWGDDPVWLDSSQGHYNLLGIGHPDMQRYSDEMSPVGNLWLDIRRESEPVEDALEELSPLEMRRILSDCAEVVYRHKLGLLPLGSLERVNVLVNQARGNDGDVDGAGMRAVGEAVSALLANDDGIVEPGSK